MIRKQRINRADAVIADVATWGPSDSMRGPLGPFDRADPRLATAHHLLYTVREACGDEEMRTALAEAMVSVREARARLQRIEMGGRGR